MRWTLTLFIIFPLLLPLALHADYELAEPPTSWRYPPEMPGSRIEVYRQAGEVKLSLPFKGLGIKAPKPGDVWGINFSRMDQPGKLDMDLMQNSSWVSIGYVGDLFKTGDLWGHLIFADKGATDSVSARKAMDATHRKIIDRYYSKEYLLKAHLE